MGPFEPIHDDEDIVRADGFVVRFPLVDQVQQSPGGRPARGRVRARIQS